MFMIDDLKTQEKKVTAKYANHPARPSAATKTDPRAKTQRALRRQDGTDLTLGDLGVFARDLILCPSRFCVTLAREFARENKI